MASLQTVKTLVLNALEQVRTNINQDSQSIRDCPEPATAHLRGRREAYEDSYRLLRSISNEIVEIPDRAEAVEETPAEETPAEEGPSIEERAEVKVTAKAVRATP